jgi:hypothetical protein
MANYSGTESALGEPRRRVKRPDRAALDHRRLRVQAFGEAKLRLTLQALLWQRRERMTLSHCGW